MENEIRRHISALRMLVTIALLCAILSFAFSFVLFKNASVPLDRLQIKRINMLEERVDRLGKAALKGSLDIDLQKAMLNMKKVADTSSGEVQAQAQKVLGEMKVLLDKLKEKKGE